MRVDVYHHFAGADDISSELRRITTAIQELTMALNAEGQKMRAAIDTATTELGEDIVAAATTIGNLVAENAGDIKLSDIQPQLDTLKAAGAALKKTATDADPAVNPTAPPITGETEVP